MKRRLTGHKVTKSQSHKIKTFFATCVLVSLCPCVLCMAQPVSSTELINNAKHYDGSAVSYSGEVIGDIMARKEYAWINVNDGKNAIGIWIKKELIRDILYTGSYKAKGDLVEITGKFNRACIEHGGDLDIHAQSIMKIGSGGRLSHSVDKTEIYLLGLTGLLTLACFLANMARSARNIPPNP